ncbi:hypothetical protein Prum_022970 [Phytohabitans rumicis]|uniref:Putative restriction endonuclease domain-containing protein n=2 Tax=Phytohabitans rumicis TaxID=1076125 RepID=A0A6V8L7M2_9ACTN|nr:hypothetical protein Prum_022970 [Phytohabitans rumicis]
MASPDFAGLRCQVIDGCLVLTPAPPPEHRRIRDRLRELLTAALPATARAIAPVVVLLPDGDRPASDLAVCDAAGVVVPARRVHTVVDVVAPRTRRFTRGRKRDLYAEAGIPCFWRIEPEAWPGYDGPLPVIAVRVRERGRWRELVVPAGRERDVPVVVGRSPGRAEVVTVRFDPAVLTADGSAVTVAPWRSVSPPSSPAHSRRSVT